jgi:shikimate kinase/3-dehydroquinate synthase
MIIWLVGPSGAGKTTLGRLLGGRRGVPFIDLDERVELASGMSIEDIFASQGEAAFRRMEWNALLELLDTGEGPRVVALGGGAVVDAGVRSLVRASGHRLFVDVDVETAIARLENGAPRPLLFEEDPQAAWTRLYRRRLQYYRDCDVSMRSDASPEALAERADELLRRLESPLWRIDSVIGGQSTTIEGYQSIHTLLDRVSEIVDGRRSIVVTDDRLTAEYGELLSDARHRLGPLFSVDAGERAKSFSSVEALVRAFAATGLTRDDVVIGFGGGVITDLAGFAASVYMRGIDCIYVPTTLLAQVDAAIGGKTAIDAAGVRNLVGTVRQPRHVLACSALLRSLPARELMSGFVESVKMGIANSAELDAICRRASEAILEGEIPENIDEVVEHSARTKLAVVERDAYDTSVRLSLNFGHTFGHALEAVEPDRHAHGEAVAFGIACASLTALELGICDSERHAQILARMLPFASPVGRDHDVAAIVAAMFTDKKRTASALRLVLPAGDGGVTIHETSDRQMLARAIAGALELLP